MRLIDADKLKRLYPQTPQPMPSIVMGSEIDNAPTVEAIPIEWIKEWFNTKMKNALLPRNYELICSWIIYDWEAENEASID